MNRLQSHRPRLIICSLYNRNIGWNIYLHLYLHLAIRFLSVCSYGGKKHLCTWTFHPYIHQVTFRNINKIMISWNTCTCSHFVQLFICMKSLSTLTPPLTLIFATFNTNWVVQSARWRIWLSVRIVYFLLLNTFWEFLEFFKVLISN